MLLTLVESLAITPSNFKISPCHSLACKHNSIKAANIRVETMWQQTRPPLVHQICLEPVSTLILSLLNTNHTPSNRLFKSNINLRYAATQAQHRAAQRVNSSPTPGHQHIGTTILRLTSTIAPAKIPSGPAPMVSRARSLNPNALHTTRPTHINQPKLQRHRRK